MNEPSSDGYDLVPSNTWQKPTLLTAQVFEKHFIMDE